MKQGMNGRMMRRCRNSLISYNKTPVHLIPLAGKMTLWYNDHLYLCKNSQLKQKVLCELHTSPLGGHLGFLKTYHSVKKEFFEMALNIIQKFVVDCLVFQQNKVKTIKTLGLLQPLAIPSQRWEEV